MVGRAHNRAGLELVGPDNRPPDRVRAGQERGERMPWHHRIRCIRGRGRDPLRRNDHQPPRRP